MRKCVRAGLTKRAALCNADADSILRGYKKNYFATRDHRNHGIIKAINKVPVSH